MLLSRYCNIKLASKGDRVSSLSKSPTALSVSWDKASVSFPPNCIESNLQPEMSINKIEEFEKRLINDFC